MSGWPLRLSDRYVAQSRVTGHGRSATFPKYPRSAISTVATLPLPRRHRFRVLPQPHKRKPRHAGGSCCAIGYSVQLAAAREAETGEREAEKREADWLRYGPRLPRNVVNHREKAICGCILNNYLHDAFLSNGNLSAAAVTRLIDDRGHRRELARTTIFRRLQGRSDFT
jgi:hypothetical protein